MPRKSGTVSIYKIAAEAGVSVATISRVLNNRTGVSDEQRGRIGALLRKYQYKVNYPISRRPKLAIVIYSPTMLNDYICKVVNGIYSSASEYQLEISTILARAEDGPIKDRIRDLQCSGAVVLLAPEEKGDFLELAETGFPVIFIDEQVNHPGIGFIDSDSYTGSRAAALHLIELGHRDIAYLQYCRSKLSHIQRLRGYQNALKNAGITPNPDYVVTLESSRDGNPDKRGYDAMQKLLARAPEVTAVMAADDSVALGAIRAIHEKGLRIPEDISIIGFDNYPHSEFYTPPLTTINHPAEEQGKLAAQAISEFLTTSGGSGLPQEILETGFIPRQSTRKRRDGQ